jgi:hypothetical protein
MTNKKQQAPNAPHDRNLPQKARKLVTLSEDELRQAAGGVGKTRHD